MTTESLYDVLFEQQGGICAICSEPLTDRFHTQIDRKMPGRKGGKYTVDNCQLIHLACDWAKEGNAPNSRYPELAAAYRMYKMWQLEAGRADRKLKAFSGDIAGTSRSPYFTSIEIDEMRAMKYRAWDKERMYEKRVIEELRQIPVAAVLLKGWGAGPMVIAHIMSVFDIRRGNRVSTLWKFFGYTPEDSAGAKGRNPGRGQLRAPLYASLSITLTRKDSPYRSFYDETKAHIAERTDKSGHGQALQRTIKLWLSHLWDTWRRAEGLPTTEPYAVSQLGHDGFIGAQDMGWPVVD